MLVPGEYEQYNFKNRSPSKDPPEYKIAIFYKAALMIYIKCLQLIYTISPPAKNPHRWYLQKWNTKRATGSNVSFLETVFIGETDFMLFGVQ
jgi:hypothetical protein